MDGDPLFAPDEAQFFGGGGFDVDAVEREAEVLGDFGTHGGFVGEEAGHLGEDRHVDMAEDKAGMVDTVDDGVEEDDRIGSGIRGIGIGEELSDVPHPDGTHHGVDEGMDRHVPVAVGFESEGALDRDPAEFHLFVCFEGMDVDAVPGECLGGGGDEAGEFVQIGRTGEFVRLDGALDEMNRSAGRPDRAALVGIVGVGGDGATQCLGTAQLRGLDKARPVTVDRLVPDVEGVNHTEGGDDAVGFLFVGDDPFDHRQIEAAPGDVVDEDVGGLDVCECVAERSLATVTARYNFIRAEELHIRGLVPGTDDDHFGEIERIVEIIGYLQPERFGTLVEPLLFRPHSETGRTARCEQYECNILH